MAFRASKFMGRSGEGRFVGSTLCRRYMYVESFDVEFSYLLFQTVAYCKRVSCVLRCHVSLTAIVTTLNQLRLYC